MDYLRNFTQRSASETRVGERVRDIHFLLSCEVRVISNRHSGYWVKRYQCSEMLVWSGGDCKKEGNSEAGARGRIPYLELPSPIPLSQHYLHIAIFASSQSCLWINGGCSNESVAVLARENSQEQEQERDFILLLLDFSFTSSLLNHEHP